MTQTANETDKRHTATPIKSNRSTRPDLNAPRRLTRITPNARIAPCGAELKETADETLFLELALRGYDLSKPLRPDAEETDNPAEIVKIG